MRWPNVDLAKRELHVRERADEYKQLGRPKSGAGERTVPLTPMVVAVLREWKLKCPKGMLGMVFPNANGGIAGFIRNITKMGLAPAQLAAGVTIDVARSTRKEPLSAPSIPACTLSVTSMQAGVSTAKPMAASNCRRRSCRNGLVIQPSP